MQCLKRDASSFHVDASINLYYIASSKCFIQGDEASLWFCCVAIDEFVYAIRPSLTVGCLDARTVVGAGTFWS